MKTFPPSLFTRGQAAGAGAAPGAAQADEFQRLVLSHSDGAYNLARYLTRDPDLSEDIVQDAVLRAFRSFGQFRGGSARAWLFAIVRNCCRTTQSNAGGRMALVVPESSLGEDAVAKLEQAPDPGPTPEESASRRSDVDRVRRAIEAIPEPFREAVVLRDLEDLSYAEIAEAASVPVGTVMSRLSRGRVMLAKELLPPATADADQSRSAN